MGQALTEDELKHLSPEEREFYESVSDEDDTVDEDEAPDFDENDYLDPDDRADGQEDDDGGDPDADAGDDGADGDDGDDPDAEGDGADDPAEDDDPAKDKDAGEDGKDGQEGEDGADDAADGDDPGDQQQGPALDYELPADWQQKMDGVQTKLTELEAEWDDGEIDADAYKEQRATLRQQEKELDRQYTKAELAADFRQQQAQNQWMNDVRSFFKDYPQFQPTGDTPDSNDNPLYDALDAQVVRIAKANPELSGKQVLSKALERFPEEVRNPGGKKGADEGKGEEKPRKGKSRRQVPPTLRNVPASSTTETDDGGKFAHLDRLEGLELEKAMSRMSDAEREAYMRS